MLNFPQLFTVDREELFWTFSTFGAANADFSQPLLLKLRKVRPQSQLSRTFSRKVSKSHKNHLYGPKAFSGGQQRKGY